uniref:Uncharacterized protein LOC100368270 n=1 Tax=Saccoglossus kowalevskii TaxID=10224 RepID=A0ABM0M511_SACKO|nr:PREDICTED: uncharacterized protein LOC100368270 [Saccoglossus kowalevskii]
MADPGDAPYKIPGQFVYEGVLYGDYVRKEILENPASVDVRKDDVFVVTYPKTGTTWTQEIMTLILNNGDFESNKKTLLQIRSPFMEFYVKINFIMKSISFLYSYTIGLLIPKSWEKYIPIPPYGVLQLADGLSHIRQMPSPILIKSHLQVKFFPPQALKNNKDPHDAVRKMAAFVERPISEELVDAIVRHTSVKNMQTNSATNVDVNRAFLDSKISPFIRKGVVGDWENYFTVAQNDEFDRIYERRMKDTDLKFECMKSISFLYSYTIGLLIPKSWEKYIPIPPYAMLQLADGLSHIIQMPSPILIKSHLQIVYVARNPKDTCVSFYHFYRIAFGDYFDHVIGWWNEKDRNNVLYLFYEDMKKDPHDAVRKMAAFVERPISEELVDAIVRHTSVKNMQTNSATNADVNRAFLDSKISPFIRKGVVGDWENYFTVAQNDEFDRIYENRMKDTDLKIECFSASDFIVTLGDHNLLENDHTEQYINVSGIYKCPVYDPTTIDCDYAILTLDHSAVLNENVSTIAMSNNYTDTGSCIISGWGTSERDESIHNILQDAEVAIYPTSNCSSGRVWGNYITDNMVCAGNGSPGTCSGDSGGPLACRDTDGNLVLQGITSWGSGDCGSMPDVYTRVSVYYDVITSQVDGTVVADSSSEGNGNGRDKNKSNGKKKNQISRGRVLRSLLRNPK